MTSPHAQVASEVMNPDGVPAAQQAEQAEPASEFNSKPMTY